MQEFENDISECLEVLKKGGLILYPTDTVWGIGCDATNETAVARIYRAKKRPDQKSMIVLVADERDVLRYVAQADLQVFDYLRTVTKPTTVVYKDAIGLASNLVSTDGSIAIRICSDHFCRQLLKRFRKPIVSTSANISGEQSPKNFAQIRDDIKTAVDYVVKYRQNDPTLSQPSTIIKWQEDRPIILRP